MISLELFNAAMGEQATKVYQSDTRTNYICYHKIVKKLNTGRKEGEGVYTEFEDYFYINIYEVAHKCKEWARDRGYEICSAITTAGCDAYIHEPYGVMNSEPCLKAITTNSEPEATFKAGEWILDEL